MTITEDLTSVTFKGSKNLDVEAKNQYNKWVLIDAHSSFQDYPQYYFYNPKTDRYLGRRSSDNVMIPVTDIASAQKMFFVPNPSQHKSSVSCEIGGNIYSIAHSGGSDIQFDTGHTKNTMQLGMFQYVKSTKIVIHYETVMKYPIMEIHEISMGNSVTLPRNTHMRVVVTFDLDNGASISSTSSSDAY